MKSLQELTDATDGHSVREMLRYLMKDCFPGEVAVTASLKAPSIVTLQLISEIDPSTPVFFCHPRPVFPESEKFRAEIVELLSLTNVNVITHSDPIKQGRPYERCERLWNEVAGGGKIRETIHLHETLAPYKCWIKAAYHDRAEGSASTRLDLHGDMVIVDAVHGRSMQIISRFMHAHHLPHHPKIRRRKIHVSPAQKEAPIMSYHF